MFLLCTYTSEYRKLFIYQERYEGYQGQMYERKITITYNEILSILFFTFLFIAKGFGLYDG